MGYEPPNVVLPPLTPAELSSRDYEERKLNVGLSACWDATGEAFDIQRALDLLRAFAVHIFVLQMKTYRERHWYSPAWVPKIMEETISRVLRCYGNHVDWSSSAQIASLLKDTLLSHMRTDPLLINHADLVRLFPLPLPSPLPLPGPPLPPEVQAQRPTTLPTTGSELKRLLEEARIRPEDIAEDIGIDPRNVYRHLVGETQPSLINIGQYEKALSRRLGRKVTLPTPAKRQYVSKTSVRFEH